MSDCFVNAKDSRCLPRYNHFFAGRATSETLAPRFFAAALGGGGAAARGPAGAAADG